MAHYFTSLTLFLALLHGHIAIAAAGEMSLDLPAHKTSIAEITHDSTLRSDRGKDFGVYRFRKNESQKNTKKYQVFYIQGGLHGNEFLVSEFVYWLAQKYAEGKSLLNQLNNADFDFVPYANPDGTFYASRYNYRGVNLNRNFGVLWGKSKENPGTTAFSERETAAIRKLFEVNKYDGAIDVHGYAPWIVMPTDRTKSNSTLRQAYQQLKKILQDLTPMTHDLKTAGELGDGGAFEDWAFWAMHVPAFCLEFTSSNRYNTNIESILNIFQNQNKKDQDSFLAYESLVYEYFKSLSNQEKIDLAIRR